MTMYEHVQHGTWFVKFVLKSIIVSEVSCIVIKLARDVLKELIETNSSKYAIEH